MSSFRSVRLVSTTDQGYLDFLQHLKSKKKMKYRQVATKPASHPVTQPLTMMLSRKVEWLVRKWLERSVSIDPHRVIAYEQYNNALQRHQCRYREIDAIYQHESTHNWEIIEIKFSCSSAAVSRASRQLTQSAQVLQTNYSKVNSRIIWITVHPANDTHPFQVSSFNPDFRKIPVHYYGNNQIPVITIHPEPLFIWGIDQGLAGQQDLDDIVAAKIEAQHRPKTSECPTVRNTIGDEVPCNNLLAIRLAEALIRSQKNSYKKLRVV